MVQIIEEIPARLQPAADAALEWINEQQGSSYKLTGLVGPDLAWQPGQGLPTELALVLCDDETCAREQVRIQWRGDGYQVAAMAAQETLIPPQLDPPVQVRSGWLDAQLAKHDFVVLIFYRGFW